MADSDFIWADLSSYNIEKSKEFYAAVFDWELSDADGYCLAKYGDTIQAGIFEMPDYLKKINMPHFWMSYFQVESTELAVSQAKALSGTIEVDNLRYNNGNIALIRDPQGAGFTVYDGGELQFSEDQNHGSVIATELQVSDINSVMPFYSKIFNWEFAEIYPDTYQIKTQNRKHSIRIREISNKLKGKYEYWVTTVRVDHLEMRMKQIIDNGGRLISREFDRNLFSDDSGEAFFYLTEA